jgi:hypothetical protein
MLQHDHSALIMQFGEHLTQQRYSAELVGSYCRNAESFLRYLDRRKIAIDAANRCIKLSTSRDPMVSTTSRPFSMSPMAVQTEIINPCIIEARARTVAAGACGIQSGRGFLSSGMQGIPRMAD